MFILLATPRRRLISVLIAIAIAGGGFAYWRQRQVDPAAGYQTEAVTRGSLRQTVKATGAVHAAAAFDLSFKISGQISERLASKGDRVRAGQVVARLRSTDLTNRVREASALVAVERAKLVRLQAGASSEDIAVSERAVASAQTSLENARVSLANALSAQRQAIQAVLDSSVNSVQNQLFQATTALDQVKVILDDRDAEPTLGVTSNVALQRLKAQRPTVVAQVQAARQSLTNLLAGQYVVAGVRAVLGEALAALRATENLLADCYDVLSGTLTTTAFSVVELDAYKTAVQAKQTAVHTGVAELQGSLSTLASTEIDQQAKVDAASAAVVNAQRVLESAQAALALKRAGPRSFEIDLQEAAVRQAEAALAVAEANLADAALTAPTDGTIAEANYEPGEQVTATKPLFRMIGSSGLEVRVNVPEVDIAKVAPAQPVEVTFDAFGDNRVFAGKVGSIDPAETLLTGATYYQVKVLINGTLGTDGLTQIKPGMTASVTVLTGQRESVLRLPSRAVKEREGHQVVELVRVEGGQPVAVEQEVRLDLRGDNGLVEVLDGVVEGERVVVRRNGKK